MNHPKKNNMDRFIWSENPMHPDDSGCFIVHTIHPEMIIRVDHETFAVGDGKMFLTANYENSNGDIETVTLTIAQFLPKNIHVTDQLRMDVDHTLQRAWRWYASYLKWEDDNIDEGNNAIFN